MQDSLATASKNQVYVRQTNGVLWWRFWNPMSKLGGWEYCQAPINDPIEDNDWAAMFDGRPIEKLWTQDQNDDGAYVREKCKELYSSEIIVDIDDWYEAIPDFNPALAVHKKYRLKHRIDKMYAEADRISCSTPFLVDKIGDKGSLAPNFVVPESWDYPARKTKREDECVLMFAGGMGRAAEIREIRDALTAFLAEPNTKIVFVGTFHEFAADYPPGKVVWSRFCEAWDYPRLVRWIAPDITISPLNHCEFNLAKSNIKWLESAMLGGCFVGERWGELERTIEDGVTGHLCDGIEEWTEKLVSLARDKKVRTETSQAAKNVVLSKWTWDTVGADWRAALGV